MALTADRIEEDLKKLLNISSAIKTDLEKIGEKGHPANGYHYNKTFMSKSEAVTNKNRHLSDQGHRDEAKMKEDKRSKRDYNKPRKYNLDRQNGQNSNSDPGVKRDKIMNVFYNNSVTTSESVGELDMVEDRSKHRTRRGGANNVWKRHRQNRQDSYQLSKPDVDVDNNGGHTVNNAEGPTTKQPQFLKKESKDKTKSEVERNIECDLDLSLEDTTSQNVESDLPNGVENTPKKGKEDLEELANALLTSVYEEHKATNEEIDLRTKAFDRLKEIISSVIPDVKVVMYGSSFSGVATKSSDVNVDITTKQTKEDFKALKSALENKENLFRNVELLHATNSLILTSEWCADGDAPFYFTIKPNVENSTRTSKLLNIYTKMDARVPVLVVCLRVWAKVYHLDRQDEGTLPPHSFHLMVIHFLQKMQALPILHEMMTREKEELESEEKDDVILQLEKLAEGWTPKKAVGTSVGLLWMKMLKYYDFFSFERQAINIRRSDVLMRNSLGWGSKNVAIEDPYCKRRNLARSMCHNAIYKFFRKQLTIIRLNSSPQNTDSASNLTLQEQIKQFFSSGPDDMLPPKMCTTCQSLGHVKLTCPEETVLQLLPLPTPKEWVFQFLDKVLEDVLAVNEQNLEEYRVKEQVKKDIESLLASIFPDKEPILTLFGSSCNGFGFRKSDLDLSLSFRGQESLEMPVCVQIINELAEGLHRDGRFREVIAITTAKVPIVKFCLGDFECDICLYNTLAQHNTRLLARYAEMDHRARVLGYAIKHLAKICHICDASKGSLSSYAYTLMAIYFLQRTVPPVLPVLQELTNGDTEQEAAGDRPSVVVEGWDVWFDETNRSWKSKNNQTPGQLWIEMVEFYSSYFDYENDVVCIRRKERLPKVEKNWNGSGIAIEDPFNLDHNLGARLTNRMSIYIRKAFQKAMVVFASEPVIKDATMCRSAKHFLFNKSKLTDGPPPNDRGCRKCFKLGHFIADCPKLQKRKQKPANEADNPVEPVANKEVSKPQECEQTAQNPRSTTVEDDHRSQPAMNQHNNNNVHVDNNNHQQQQQPRVQLGMPPSGMANRIQSPQKRPPLIQVPPNFMPILSQCSQVPQHFYQPRGYLVPQFQQIRLQQPPMSMSGMQMRLPQTIPSLNTVFKRSDFPQSPQDSHFHPYPPHHPTSSNSHHPPPHHLTSSNSHHPPPQSHHQQASSHHQYQSTSSHQLPSSQVYHSQASSHPPPSSHPQQTSQHPHPPVTRHHYHHHHQQQQQPHHAAPNGPRVQFHK